MFCSVVIGRGEVGARCADQCGNCFGQMGGQLAQGALDQLHKAKLGKSAFEEAVSEGSGSLIDYEGKVRKTNKYCVASFPGKYGKQWNQVTDPETPSSIACVFMQPGGEGYGRHIRPKGCWFSQKECYCHQLYGERTEWGCYWFGPWMDNVKEAVALGQTLLVFFFEGQMGKGIPEPEDIPWASFEQGVGLGNSQKGEVAFMKSKGFEFECRDMQGWTDFAAMEMLQERAF